MTVPNQPRDTSQVEGAQFPYGATRVCYIEVDPADMDSDFSTGVRQLHYKDDRRDAVERARRGQSVIFAVWPGEYRSDLFRVDDLDALAKAWRL